MTHRQWSSRRSRGLRGVATVILVVGSLLLTTTTGAAAQPPPPCINYVHHEPGGRVEVDLRLDPRSGTFGSLVVFWFINDPGAAPGIYNWSHIVNGRSLTPRLDIKDDNFHTTFHTREGWFFGDTYKFQATHYSPATRTTYVSAVNECLITPR
jgi:hypothetical protein